MSVQFLHRFFQLEIAEDLLYVMAKTVEIHTEVDVNILRIIQQSLQCIVGCIIKGVVICRLAQDRMQLLRREFILESTIGLVYLFIVRRENTIHASKHDEWEQHFSQLVALEGKVQDLIENVPNEVYIRLLTWHM